MKSQISKCFSKPNKAAELSGVFLALLVLLGIWMVAVRG